MQRKINDFFIKKTLVSIQSITNFAPGELAEWSNAAVLKTVVPRGTGGSNPSLSAGRERVLRNQDSFF